MPNELKIERIYQQIEMELLTNIASHFASDMQLERIEDIQMWQVDKLAELGVLTQEQLRILRRGVNQRRDELELFVALIVAEWLNTTNEDARHYEALQALDYIPEGGRVREPLISDAHEPLTTEERVRQYAQPSLEQTIQDFSNVEANLLRYSEEVYMDIVNEAASDMLINEATIQESITKVLKKWGENGVPALIDQGGRYWSGEAYVSMLLRAKYKQIGTEVSNARMDELGVDLVKVSSHVGSRPTHIEYQNKVFSRNGNSTKYPALSSTSYGLIDGIITGINCAHFLYMYIDGISEPPRAEQDYDKAESEEIYKQSQKQRYYERQIRKAKKQELALSAANAPEDELEKAHRKVLDRQARMRKFIKQSGRERRYNREQVVNP